MKYKKTISWGLFIITIAIGSVFAMNFALGQFEYYDPYSNSTIDYFPTNPINTSSRTKNRSTGTSGIAPKTNTVPSPQPAPEKTPAKISCSNRPTPNPQNTRSVEIRDASGKVFYLSPPKEEVLGVRADPETAQKIFKDEAEIGLITVDNECYPKYGYIQDLTPKPIDPPLDFTVPSNRTAVKLDPATGNVYHEKTGERIEDARYDAAARTIYYKDTNSIFGKVFTETTGYVNIEVTGVQYAAPTLPPRPAPLSIKAKKCTQKTAVQFNEEQPYHFCYRSDATLVGIMPNTANLKITSSDDPVSVFTITYYNNSATINDVMKNWHNVKKKKVQNKNSVTGLTYTLRDADPSSPLHYGAILINAASHGQEFVHIQFADSFEYPPKPFRFPKEFQKLIQTFRFQK